MIEKAKVLEALREVQDPELGKSLVELMRSPSPAPLGSGARQGGSLAFCTNPVSGSVTLGRSS